MKLNIFRETNVRVPRQKIIALFETICRAESKSAAKGQVNLILTTDSRLRSLNSQYRNINNPTDVLSFNIDSPGNDDRIVGEIYIAAPTATRQARRFGTSLSQELLRLTCHGLLHLFGHDHETSDQRQKMESLEDSYLVVAGGKQDA
ncbi:MAG: rRNA maturation RNase YbeY [candidate division Zixibacteria bacterium]|nr:rRNA maturation RNase YbeY [candidate division Zixibacteria bacterium]